MRKTLVLACICIVALCSLSLNSENAAASDGWSVRASYIEACSCNLFCPCYFNTAPDKDFCKYNNAVKIIEGHVGDVKLDGMKIWMSGDLGGDFTKGLKSTIITFEPSATKEQVDAAMIVIKKVYGDHFAQVTLEPQRMPITWERKGMNGYAKLGDGVAEVTLTGVMGPDKKSLVKIDNLQYWGAQKNGGFQLAKSKHHYKGNGLEYSFDDANGFFIDIESSGS
jgi:hypothetical protein